MSQIRSKQGSLSAEDYLQIYPTLLSATVHPPPFVPSAVPRLFIVLESGINMGALNFPGKMKGSWEVERSSSCFRDGFAITPDEEREQGGKKKQEERCDKALFLSSSKFKCHNVTLTDLFKNLLHLKSSTSNLQKLPNVFYL